MSKIHFTRKYEFPNDGSIRSLSVCGLYTHRHRNFINTTVVEEDVNCQKCLKIIIREKQAGQNYDNHPQM